MKKFWYSTIIVICITMIAACSQEEKGNTEEDVNNKTIPVEVEEATTDDFIVEKSVYGRTAPVTSVPVIVQNPGEIDSLDVKNGDKVEKNDRIGKISTPMGKQSVKAQTEGEVANLQTEGSMATTEEPIAMIVDTEEMNVTFSVTANVHKLLKYEDKWPVFISDEEYEAEITSIGTLPSDTGLYSIQARVDNADDDILAGMIAEMSVEEKVVESTIIIPTEAVVEEGGETFVYVIKDNEAIKTEVNVKETQTDQSAVEGEIKEGDQVVVSGQLTLSDQSKVEVVKEGKSS
ncbi:efflux RND transporter periplasmic adaptor subunit [Virgibacillus sp. W0181]|uniref:efflux RND transporter periplasmic adaptor subunit n=1 Tax=Virgibacillus sp. W0181 TaxID=3391581 RepID=UPI003F467E48